MLTLRLSNYQEFIIDVMEEQSLRTLQQVYQCAVSAVGGTLEHFPCDLNEA